MKTRINCILLFTVFAVLVSCEDVYYAKVDTINNVITADARIIYGSNENYIKLFESISFNEKDFEIINLSGAKVDLIDSDNNVFSLPETTNGVFFVNFILNPELNYKLRIIYGGNTYESSYESVPLIPEIDTIYGVEEEKLLNVGGANSSADFQRTNVFQFYVDISEKEDLKYYRFGGKRIYQNHRYLGKSLFGGIYLYIWGSLSFSDLFNLAAPAEYANTGEINRHPVFSLEKSAVVDAGNFFDGWIVIMHQYGISESTYNYYKDLNYQLQAEGKIFDPLYVQPVSNLKCVNNPGQLILGNFEISSVKESRYWVSSSQNSTMFFMKSIPYFYDIPEKGEQLDTFPHMPDFWEHLNKIYP